MTWTAPMSAISGSVFTAAQFNLFVRDNFLETAPAKVTGPSQWIVGVDANEIAARQIVHGVNDNGINVTSTIFDFPPDFGGPNVPVFTGTSALVFLTMQASNNTAGHVVKMSLSNVGSSVPGDATALTVGGVVGAAGRATVLVPIFGMSVGLHTFEPLYRVTGGTGSISMRRITVMPL